MIISKYHIDAFLECRFKFGKYVLNDKYTDISKPKESIVRMKDHIKSIASYEMKENVKLDLAEYRTKYTNKYFTNKKSIVSILDSEVLITKLNNLFANFSNEVFIGYNIPIDISIYNTNIIYRDIVDFGLIDDEKNLTFIEFEDFSNAIAIKDKIKYWAHYYTTYSFLSSSFNKDIKVKIIDPDVNDIIEMKFIPSRFEDDYQELCNLITPIKDAYLYKNLYNCKICSDSISCQ